MITKEEIKKLAHISRIILNEDEITIIMKDINEVCAYIDILKDLNLNEYNYQRLTNHQKNNVLRMDTATIYSHHDILMQNAPVLEADQFVVPPMIERE